VALITGGASGIGAELARQLAARGMRIALIDRDARAARLDPAGRRDGGRRRARRRGADRRDRRPRAPPRRHRRRGRQRGIATGGPLRMVGPDTVEDTIEINLLGVWRTARAALPHVLERRGHILMIASAAAVLPRAGWARIPRRRRGSRRSAARCGSSSSPTASPSGSRTTCSSTRRWSRSARRARPAALEVAAAGADRQDVAARAGDRAHGDVDREALAVVGSSAVPARADGGRAACSTTRSPIGAMVAGVTDMETAFAAEAERVGADAAARSVGNN
jgi:hypothetical protein